MKYIKPLDGYRGLAVGLVIFEHWLPPKHFTKILPWGYIGVTMFFVLSGFLITSILLKSNEAISSGKIKPLHAFKTFYIRRALRIFPVYYLLLISFYLFYPAIFGNDRKSLYAFFTYTTNIYMYVKEHWLGSFTPLWSLAVEEQFYLVWPVIVLFSIKKRLVKIVILLAIGAFLFRLVFSMSDVLSRNWCYDLLTPACMDSFGAGALLSLFYDHPEQFKKFKRIVNWLAPISLVVFLVLIIYFPNWGMIVYRTPLSIISLWLLLVITNDKDGIAAGIFSNSFLVYIGKISYGIYLFHFFVPQIYMHLSDFCERHGYRILFTKYALFPFVGGNKQYILYFAFLMAVTSLSYYCFERPINNMKRFFEYENAS